ncbi:MAG: SH3 domain-containing protein [Lachnospiraceae bacterium]|nr:SH3 domain-containing protein [Lachnospiraceae bacterium]
MENRKKRKNKSKNNQNTKTNTTTENTEVLNNKAEQTTEESQSASEVKTEAKIQSIQPKNEDKISENRKTTQSLDSMIGKDVKDFSADHVKGIAINAAKILLPVAACAIVIAVIISYAGTQKAQMVDNTADNGESGLTAAGMATLNEEPLAENAYVNINDMMNVFYNALASGDMDTVRAVKDYNSDKEIIAYEKKSEFIERYDNIKCYTKPGIEENSYFVYVTYDVKIQNIDTEAPGLNAFYVYTSEDGNLMIDGDTEENIKAAFKLVTNQDDVVDLYNKINVNYNEAIASDEALDQFLNELPQVLKESVGVELAKLETQNETVDTPPTETAAAEPAAAEPEQQPAQEETPPEPEQPLENKTVNQIVRTTDTVNVRSSDSEEADKIGKAQAGTELTRIEERVNGWSKVIFEDKEAYIKSDYLEVLTAEATVEPIGTITARTNVNVRSQANQESSKLGTAQAGSSYDLLEEQGEWFKINYNGITGFVKAEFFDR